MLYVIFKKLASLNPGQYLFTNDDDGKFTAKLYKAISSPSLVKGVRVISTLDSLVASNNVKDDLPSKTSNQAQSIEGCNAEKGEGGEEGGEDVPAMTRQLHQRPTVPEVIDLHSISESYGKIDTESIPYVPPFTDLKCVSH